jgi:hypothetical protein
VVEERPAESKCMVSVNDHRDAVLFDFNCVISCESIEAMKRCREQLVGSFAAYFISWFPCGLIGEDQYDIYSLMVVGSGVYVHLTISDMSQNQLSDLEKRISEFKYRQFSETDTINGRILIHGGSSTGMDDVMELAELFQRTPGLDEMLVQMFPEDDHQGVNDIDIWLFPVKKE